MKKKTQFSKNREKYLKILKYVIWIIGFVIILGVLYYFISSQISQLKKLEFSSNFSNEFIESDRDVSYSRSKPFTLLFLVEYDGNQKDQIDGFVIVQLNYESRSATVVSIHPNTYLYSTVYTIDPADTNLVRIKDLFVVGGLETPPKTCAYAVYSIEELMAIHVDGYIWVPSETLSGFLQLGRKEIPTELFEEDMEYEEWALNWNEFWVDYFDSVSLINIWRNRDVISQIYSNMDVISAFSFIDDFGTIKADNVFSVTLSQDQLQEQTNNQGDIVDVVTKGSVDKALNGYLQDLTVDREQARVEIFNGSKIDGLGSRYERWIEHLGADVIRVQNAPGEWEQTTVFVTDMDEFSYTLEKIVDLWGENIKVVERRPDFITTGDIIIVLGLDFSEH
ncbi:MAG: LCP family protein [bacterium]